MQTAHRKYVDNNRPKIISDIMSLGHSENQSAEMLDTYIQHGGLVAKSIYGEEFSWCSNTRNVLDVLLDHKL
jgi:aspartokinase